MAVEDLSWITWRYLATALRGIAAERPEQRNPMGPHGVCLYDDGVGGRCIIGQFLHDEGVDTSELRPTLGAAQTLTRLGTRGSFAWGIVSDVQLAADGGLEKSVEKPLPAWGKVVAALTRRRVL